MTIGHSIVGFLAQRGIPAKIARHNLQVCCPFCTDYGHTADTRFRLGIDMTSGGGRCFNCDWKRRQGALTALFKRLGITGVRVIDNVAAAPPITAEQRLQLPEHFMPLWPCARADLNDKMARAALGYLKTRGVTAQQVRQHQVGLCYAGAMAGRIVFPVKDGKVLRMLVGRAFLGSSKMRYLNTPGSKYLWGVNGTKTAKRCVLSEGIFKGLALEHVASRDGYVSIALLGHEVVDTQLAQLKALRCEEVVVWPDPDKPGLQGAVGICAKLSAEGYRVFVTPAARAQADEIDVEERQYLWSLRAPASRSNLTKLLGLASFI